MWEIPWKLVILNEEYPPCTFYWGNGKNHIQHVPNRLG